MACREAVQNRHGPHTAKVQRGEGVYREALGTLFAHWGLDGSSAGTFTIPRIAVWLRHVANAFHLLPVPLASDWQYDSVRFPTNMTLQRY